MQRVRGLMPDVRIFAIARPSRNLKRRWHQLRLRKLRARQKPKRAAGDVFYLGGGLLLSSNPEHPCLNDVIDLFTQLSLPQARLKRKIQFND